MSDNPGNPGRGRGRGSGRGRQSRSGSRQRGRPLNASDRTLVIQLWLGLNSSGRQQLVTMLQELGATFEEPSGNTPPVERQEPSSAVPEKSQDKRQRVWDREILKDIPAVQRFKEKSPKERGQDTETSTRLSIATGVIARGRALNVNPEDILKALLQAWDDKAMMHGLYLPPSRPPAGGPATSSSGNPVVSGSVARRGPNGPPSGSRESGLMDKQAMEDRAVEEAKALSLRSQNSGEDQRITNTVNGESTTTREPGIKVAASATKTWASDCETTPETHVDEAKTDRMDVEEQSATAVAEVPEPPAEAGGDDSSTDSSEDESDEDDQPPKGGDDDPPVPDQPPEGGPSGPERPIGPDRPPPHRRKRRRKRRKSS